MLKAIDEIRKKDQEKYRKIEKFFNNAIALIEKESKDINNDLFKTYFNFLVPIDVAKKLFETKDKKKNMSL